MLGVLRARYPLQLVDNTAFFVKVAEPGADPSETQVKKRIKSDVDFCVGLAAVLDKTGDIERAFDVQYMDTDSPKWTDLDDGTTTEDLKEPYTFLVRFKVPKRTFSHQALLNGRGEFKKFLNGTSGALQLREPQSASLLKMCRFLEPAEGGEKFLVVLPTGCGKTLVMSLAPFILDAGKVLIILPNVTIKDQIVREITRHYHSTHSVGKTTGAHVSVQAYDGKNSKLEADVILTNIQYGHIK